MPTNNAGNIIGLARMMGLFGGQAKDTAEQENRIAQNNALAASMITQSLDRAHNYGENPLSTPEAEKAFKAVGGDPLALELITRYAGARASTPEVMARRGLQQGAAPMISQTDEQMAQPNPPGPRDSTGAEIAQNIQKLTPEQRAFAFPAYGAAEKEAAVTARDQAHARMFESAARSNDASAILPAAQAKHLEMQTAEGPKQTAIAQQQVSNQAAALQAARREAELAHADRMAQYNVQLQQVGNDRERIKIERERNGFMEQHQKAIEGLQKEQNANQTAQLGLQVAQHLLDKQVPAGPAALASKQILEIMQGGGRKRLDPELEALTGVSSSAAVRLGQLNTQLQKSQEDIRGLASSIPVSLKKGEIAADSVALVMRKHNEALVDTLHVQAEEAKRGIIPFNPISNPQQYAFENMLIPDKDGNPMTPAAYTTKYKTTILDSPAVPPRFQTLPAGPDEAKTNNPQETTYKGILGRITGTPEGGKGSAGGAKNLGNAFDYYGEGQPGRKIEDAKIVDRVRSGKAPITALKNTQQIDDLVEEYENRLRALAEDPAAPPGRNKESEALMGRIDDLQRHRLKLERQR